MALLGVMLMTLILTVFGFVSLNLAMQEIQQGADARDIFAARYVAEAGIAAMIERFHAPLTDDPSSVFRKRYEHQRGPTFFNAAGQSQFTGTKGSPDVLFDTARPADNQLLNDPTSGWFRGLGDAGTISSLKVYAPQRRGLLCTTEIVASSRGVTRVVSVQLGALPIAAINTAAQIGAVDSRQSGVPAQVHWGTMSVGGDVHWASGRDVPLKSGLAPVHALSYADMVPPEDRWLEIHVGGAASVSPDSPPLPMNVYGQQQARATFNQDPWPYEEMKAYAKLYGTYYVIRRDGLLYRNGMERPGAGVTPDEVFQSRGVGDDRGLVFIDADAGSTTGGDLPSVDVTLRYAQGLFIINAHVRLKVDQMGESINALSPPTDPPPATPGRIPVKLTNIHLRGVLKVMGNLFYDGSPRFYGAVSVGGMLSRGTPHARPLEVWYDYDFSKAYFRGLPVVYIAPGTWQER